MSTLKCDEAFSVGVKALDVEHKRLCILLGRLRSSLAGGVEGSVLLKVDALAGAAASHFQHEERLLRLTEFPGLRPHEREHAGLLRKVHKVQLSLRAGEADALTLEVVHDLVDWLERHIRDSDKDFSSYLNLRGIR